MRLHPVLRLAALAALLSSVHALAQSQSSAKLESSLEAPPPSGRKPDPTKAQTEEWLADHLEAWDEGEVYVTVRECRVVILDKRRERTSIIDLRGLLLPVELIDQSSSSSDVTIRLRVKQKHTGTFSMYRSCTAQNSYCADATGKFQTLPYVDLTITGVSDYASSTHSTNVDKARRMERALEHYARLCGATEDARNRIF